MEKVQRREHRSLELPCTPALRQSGKAGKQFMRNFVIPICQAKTFNGRIREF
jgi:hypothetical protein